MNVRPGLAWRPKTTLILIVGLVSLLVYSVAAYAAMNFRPTTEVRIGSGVYSLWVVDSKPMLEKGLGGTESLTPGGGLLMKFDTDYQHGIWMKDMKIPIDIIWINKEKSIVHIVKNASPELSTEEIFTPKAPARYVIELPAGSVKTAGIKVGQEVFFDDLAPGISW